MLDPKETVPGQCIKTAQDPYAVNKSRASAVIRKVLDKMPAYLVT